MIPSDALLLVDRKTVPFAGPPATHGRSPSWHCTVPVGQVLPPSGLDTSASFARSMPVMYVVPPASVVMSGSEKPRLPSGGVKKPVPFQLTRCQLRPSSADVQRLTWSRYLVTKSASPCGAPASPPR